jgi:cyclin T
MRSFDRWHYAAASVFLACKLDDCLRDLDSLIKCYHHHLEKLNFKRDEDKTRLRDLLCEAEWNLLQAMGFDFDLQLPYKWLEEFKTYKPAPNPLLIKIAHNFLNDSFLTLVALYYEPPIIALAALRHAMKFLNTQIPNTEDDKPWFKFFSDDTDIELVNQCADHMYEVYKYAS